MIFKESIKKVIENIKNLNLKKIYLPSGGKLKKLDKTIAQHSTYNEILKAKKAIDQLTLDLQECKIKLSRHYDEINGKNMAISTIENLTDSLDKLHYCERTAVLLSSKYADHQESIGSIDEYTKDLGTTDSEIRKHIETESFNKATDLKHKIILTALRGIQIPIFIFITYSSVNYTVKHIGEKDLVIPRGLISIIPSSLENSANKLTATEKTTISTSKNNPTAKLEHQLNNKEVL